MYVQIDWKDGKRSVCDDAVRMVVKELESSLCVRDDNDVEIVVTAEHRDPLTTSTWYERPRRISILFEDVDED